MLSTYAGCDAETVAMFRQADLEEEMTATTMNTTFFPEGFEGLLDGIASAVVAAKPKKPTRKSLLSDARAAVAKGELPPLLTFAPSAWAYEKHSKALLDLASAGDLEGLKAYPIGGVNTASRALRGYRDLLLGHLDAKAAAAKPAKPKAAKKITAGKVVKMKEAA